MLMGLNRRSWAIILSKLLGILRESSKFDIFEKNLILFLVLRDHRDNLVKGVPFTRLRSQDKLLIPIQINLLRLK